MYVQNKQKWKTKINKKFHCNFECMVFLPGSTVLGKSPSQDVSDPTLIDKEDNQTPDLRDAGTSRQSEHVSFWNFLFCIPRVSRAILLLWQANQERCCRVHRWDPDSWELPGSRTSPPCDTWSTESDCELFSTSNLKCHRRTLYYISWRGSKKWPQIHLEWNLIHSLLYFAVS